MCCIFEICLTLKTPMSAKTDPNTLELREITGKELTESLKCIDWPLRNDKIEVIIDDF